MYYPLFQYILGMNCKKAIGYGIGLWVLMFVIISALIGFNAYQTSVMHIAAAVIGGIISFIFAGYVKPSSMKFALSYGAVWVVVGLVLDALITMRFNQTIFSSRSLWLGYALVLLAPLLRVQMVKPVEKLPA